MGAFSLPILFFHEITTNQQTQDEHEVGKQTNKKSCNQYFGTKFEKTL